jgi:hypothetical protein
MAAQIGNWWEFDMMRKFGVLEREMRKWDIFIFGFIYSLNIDMDLYIHVFLF